MNVKQSLRSKQEFLEIIKMKYQNATWDEKSALPLFPWVPLCGNR